MSNIPDLVKLSKYAGERFDLIQAGGGNTSVKNKSNKYMWIKASGCSLSEVEIDHGYCKVDNIKVLSILENKKLLKLKEKSRKEKMANRLLSFAVIHSSQRPSIETYMHSLLGKYVLHTHPVAVNVLTSRKSWKKELMLLFKKPLLIDYRTPGLELALKLKKEIFIYKQRCRQLPKVIFLQNHGLIVNSDSLQELLMLTEKILKTIEKSLKISMNTYKLTTKISGLLNKVSAHNGIAYLSTEKELNDSLQINSKLFYTRPFCPDRMVFCGFRAVKIKSLKDCKTIEAYRQKYQQLPKIIIFKQHLFFIASNLKKAKEMEDVFKMHIKVLFLNENNINYLTDKELFYLDSWEAEKHRQKN